MEVVFVNLNIFNSVYLLNEHNNVNIEDNNIIQNENQEFPIVVVEYLNKDECKWSEILKSPCSFNEDIIGGRIIKVKPSGLAEYSSILFNYEDYEGGK